MLVTSSANNTPTLTLGETHFLAKK